MPPSHSFLAIRSPTAPARWLLPWSRTRARSAGESSRPQHQNRPGTERGPRGPFGFDPELYAGGRKGYGFERSADLLLKLCCMIRAVSLWGLRACVCVCSDVMRNGAMRKMTLRREERFRRSLQETDEVEKGEHMDRALTSRRTNGESHENISRSLFYQKCYVSPFPPLNKINKKCKVIVTFNPFWLIFLRIVGYKLIIAS